MMVQLWSPTPHKNQNKTTRTQLQYVRRNSDDMRMTYSSANFACLARGVRQALSIVFCFLMYSGMKEKKMTDNFTP